MTRISCLKCRTVLQATPEQARKTIACPSCQTQMRLPPSSPQPQPAVVGPPPLPDQAVPPPVKTPEDEWYYAKDGQKVGPVTKDDLKTLVRTGQLSGSDMVWRAGMAGWKPASQVKGLFKTIPPAAPPVPAKPSLLSPTSRCSGKSGSSYDNACGRTSSCPSACVCSSA
jgi:hypothetical protein